MRATATALAISAALAIGVAACGGDTAEQLDAEALVSRADEICKDGIDRFAEIQADQPGNSVEAEDQTEALFEVASNELNELRELRPPDDLREDYDAYLESRGRALDQLERGLEAAAARDGTAYSAAQDKVTAGQPGRIKLARAIGLEACSQPG